MISDVIFKQKGWRKMEKQMIFAGAMIFCITMAPDTIPRLLRLFKVNSFLLLPPRCSQLRKHQCSDGNR
ncbi:hypothetical protein E1A91_A01G178700v1 [Gossypium mustelinum]|uniref:Uncharacterized protein n=1 Tax=Gossypium mustelinum TaxID=34275 RepID=A0A5D3AJH1_GOSMU|nr:hypothetical protein E1A91_A01G178700v1 [Gossypium mustelinum]